MIFLVLISGILFGYASLWLADTIVNFAKTDSIKPYPFVRRSQLIVSGLSGLLFGLLYAQMGQTQDFWMAAAFTAFLILIVVIDIKYRLILNVMVYPAGLLALIWTLSAGDARTMLVGGFFAFSIFYAVRMINPSQLGGGDVKLAALLGIVFGFPHILFVLLIGTGTGAIAAVSMLRQGGTKQSMPYAPFLVIGALAVLLVQI